ncbi:hypothetical protein THRCLA_07245 [Thraustotheca clavata]|uniref:Uncharacterized protein n=1 Tax=Thraustotheca clavata TaxID=74557 RepID=A0A1V9ZF43_9STRA|nr:hypothetical protein THRCLA_07245 [Thraustotheca clavata]
MSSHTLPYFQRDARPAAFNAASRRNHTVPLVCLNYEAELCDTATDVCPPCLSAGINSSTPICVNYTMNGTCPQGFKPWGRRPNVTILPSIVPTTDMITWPPTTNVPTTTIALPTTNTPTTNTPTTNTPTTNAPSTNEPSTTVAIMSDPPTNPATTQHETNANVQAENKREQDQHEFSLVTAGIVIAVAAVAIIVGSVLFVRRPKTQSDDIVLTPPRRDILVTQKTPGIEQDGKRYSDWIEINAVVSPQGNNSIANGTPMELWDELPILQRNRERQLTELQSQASEEA